MVKIMWHPRLSLAVVMAVLCVWGATAQQPTGAQAAGGGRTTFTGATKSLSIADVHSSRIHFDPGARTYWHIHQNGQVILVEDGKGLAQVEGQSIQVMVQGKPVFLPAGKAHWHGAAPDHDMTQLTTYFGDITWKDAVTDSQYRGAKK